MAPTQDQAPEQRQVPPQKVRDAYLANSRLRVGGIVARITAVFLTLGFLGSLGTWGKEHSIFEMASNRIETARPGIGYVAGPLLILIILPLVRRRVLAQTGEDHWFAHKRMYRARVVIAALLFFAGLVVLAVNLGQLESDYVVRTGTYVAASLLSVGLAATLAMWPAGLPVVRLDEGGRIEGSVPKAETGGREAAPVNTPPPGWYPNPGGPGKRYWDGTRWTEQYSEAPAQSQGVAPTPAPTPAQGGSPAPVRAQGGNRHRGRHAAVWIASLAGAALLGALAIAAFHDLVLEDNGQEQAAKRADRSYQRLIGAIDRSESRASVAVHKTFGHLARVSTAHPYGGPALAQCTPLCEKATETVHQSRQRLEAAYRSSPGYLRRIYRRAFRSTKRVLTIAAQYTDALAEWTRVHGASEYEGAAEFDVVQSTGDQLEVVIKQNHRSLDRARRHWHRYAKRRWGLQYH